MRCGSYLVVKGREEMSIAKEENKMKREKVAVEITGGLSPRRRAQ